VSIGLVDTGFNYGITWVGAAYLAGLITSRLFLPPLVGYLMAGYVLNVAGVEANETLNHLADIGIELLLFTVGLKLKPSSLLRREHILDSTRKIDLEP
jgi:predicted Kef-type K+ transport protein